MKYEIIGRDGFAPTEAIKEYAKKKLSKVVSLFGPDIIKEVIVVCKVYPTYHKIEVTIPADGIVMRAEAQDRDMYAAIDKSVDKLSIQIRKHKDKLKTKLEKTSLSQVFSNEFDLESLEKEVLATQLVKNKKIELVPLTSDEAITAMELLGHSFYVYLDKITQKTNVVYRREDGNYAVIETQAV